MKPLKILIIDNKLTDAEKLEERLEHNPGILKPFPIDYVSSQYNADTGIRDVATLSPDMVILDHSISENTGLEVARDIKRLHPHIPIILRSKLSPDNEQKLLRVAINQTVGNGKQRSLFNAYIGSGMRTPEIQQLIRNNLRKPLRPGVIGLGNFGRDFLRHFARSDEFEYAKGFSRRRKDNDEPVLSYDRVLKSMDHLGDRLDKIALVDSIEGVIEDTDFVVIATSAIRTKSLLDKLAKEDHRLDLITPEGCNIYNIFREIADIGYDGLVIPFTNPVGGNIALGQHAGIPTNQLLGLINIDEERFYTALQKRLGQETRFLLGGNNIISGHHGDPVYTRVKGEEEYRGRVWRAINEAAIESRKTAANFVESADDLEDVKYEATPEAVKFLETLAHFQEVPNIGVYGYHKINGSSGIVAAPSRFSFYPLRVHSDVESIGDITDYDRETLKNQLALTEIYAGEFIRTHSLKPAG